MRGLRFGGRRPRICAVMPATALLLLAGCGRQQSYELMDKQGSGNHYSPTFVATSPWTLLYSYDCTSRSATGGMTIEVYNDEDDTLIAEDPDVITMNAPRGKKLQNVPQKYKSPGTYYFRVISGCSWRLQVRQVQ